MSVWKMMILAAGGALVLAACGSSTSGVGECAPKGAASGTATATQTVKINPDPNTVGRFDPTPLQVKVGDTVEWDWTDTSVQHSATSDDGTTFDSCLQSAGAKFLVTFSSAGDFKYSCSIHANMHGEVKVS